MTKIADYVGKSAVENVETAIAKARETADYHALLSLTQERALRRAEEIDSSTRKGRLAGVPFVVKDNFLAFGAPTTAAAKILEDFNAPLQATAVERLEAEGAICIGKANLDAFAHGSSTENSAFGPTKNAHDNSKVAGGSSGGSAVVTALDVVPFALGSDTGGSIRQPASFNGVVGFKPSYGAVSRYGVVAMASSTDCIGSFTTTVEDAELVLSIMGGRDTKDMTTVPDYFSPSGSDTKLTVGVIKEFMTDAIDGEVHQGVSQYIEAIRAAGHEIKEISLPILKYTLAMYYIIVPAEVSSNLARYDGIRYGKRAKTMSLSELYGKSRDEGFMPENKRRIMIGSYVLSSGFFDAYYQKAQKARTLLIREFNAAFSDCDLLVSPTVPSPAFGFGENTDDPIKMYLSDAMTVAANLTGIPALSVPVSMTKSGLPIGAQLMAPYKADASLLAFARSMEDN